MYVYVRVTFQSSSYLKLERASCILCYTLLSRCINTRAYLSDAVRIPKIPSGPLMLTEDSGMLPVDSQNTFHLPRGFDALIDRTFKLADPWENHLVVVMKLHCEGISSISEISPQRIKFMREKQHTFRYVFLFYIRCKSSRIKNFAELYKKKKIFILSNNRNNHRQYINIKKIDHKLYKT